MPNNILRFIVIILLISGSFKGAYAHGPDRHGGETAGKSETSVPLLDGLYELDLQITAKSLRAQKRFDEADDIERRFRRAWARADVQLTGPRF